MITDLCGPGYACVVCRTPGPQDPGGTPSDPAVLTVVIVATPYGPACLSRCALCVRDGRFPTLTADAARQLTAEHREHVAGGAS